jgi:aminoglycoside phosphotransferase (APT) family kinase protein
MSRCQDRATRCGLLDLATPVAWMHMSGRDAVDSTTEIAGINAPAITQWMAERVPGLVAPISFALITGGLSNLTYLLSDANDNRWVLRRPPLGHVLATAHDMGREFRIISALQQTTVPVPPLVGFCEDSDTNGAPFYVMDHVQGIIARDVSAAQSMSIESRQRAGAELIDVLGSIHEVDIDAVGLGDLGRRESYVERQLSRWHRQWEATKDGENPIMEALHQRLADDVPVQGIATIVHGDYRLDNCILNPDGTIASVLDWELCTLGDPLADVGLMLVYWSEPGDAVSVGLPQASTVEGFVSRQQLLDLYAARTGKDLSSIGYYVALGYWKLACILQGVLVRYRAGAMGTAASDDNPFASQVSALAEAGMAALDGRIGSR